MSSLLHCFGLKKNKSSSTSSPDADVLTLSSLPPDIIRLVIEAKEDSIDAVKLVRTISQYLSLFCL